MESSTPPGKVVVRHVYIDGRCTAVVSSDMEWGIIVFPTLEVAEAFAQKFNLEFQDVSTSD